MVILGTVLILMKHDGWRLGESNAVSDLHCDRSCDASRGWRVALRGMFGHVHEC